MTLREDIEAGVRAIPGVVEAPSQFAPKPAFWIDGREFFHFENEGGTDVRLGRRLIRERRAELKADDRVELHGSDWVFVKIEGPDDRPFVLGLAQAAAEAARSPNGASPKAVPDSALLARVRRLHGAPTDDLET